MPDEDQPGAELVGRRFVTDFRVESVADDEERTVTVRRYGETYRMGLAELLEAIISGFVIEAGKES